MKYGIEVDLLENFNIVRETLERLGIANKRTKVLNPSCYLLHKRGKYYICHFKELFMLDGRKVDNFSDEDVNRRNTIAKKLEKWDLVEIVEPEALEEFDESCFLFVLKYDMLDDWEIAHKYSIGSKK